MNKNKIYVFRNSWINGVEKCVFFKLFYVFFYGSWKFIIFLLVIELDMFLLIIFVIKNKRFFFLNFLRVLKRCFLNVKIVFKI